MLMKEIVAHLQRAIKEMTKEGNIGVLFSGGVDSTTISFILKKLGKDFRCYTAGLDEEGLGKSKDIEESINVAEFYGFKHKIIRANLDEAEQIIHKVVPVIKSRNVVKVGVALPFYLAMEEAKKDNITVMLSGLGSEEIFAGYDRHRKATDINEECKRGLAEIKERDLDRDNAIARHFNMELKMPFLDKDLVEFALKIPGEMKISGENNKLILREAAIMVGIEEKFAMRKKMGAQYGSRFDKAIEKIAKKKGFEKKSEYLNSI